MDKKLPPLKVPIFENLDRLSDDEVGFYFDYWQEKYDHYKINGGSNEDVQNAVNKYLAISKEKRRRKL